jgi:hypothetical protein
MIGLLIGFLSSALPHLFDFFKEKQDNEHELNMLDMQIKLAQANASIKMQEIAANADIAEITAIHQPQVVIGVKWIDGLIGSVRPVVTYLYFLLYGGLKIFSIYQNGVQGLVDTPWLYWTEIDAETWSAIISFWFGSRAFEKMRNAK